MQPQTVGKACSIPSRKHWTIAPDVEITLEANPTSVEATRFRAIARRASIACRSACRRWTMLP
jgi:coproporphyrinogen III oxidase-like Fe-S oxidoreductase